MAFGKKQVGPIEVRAMRESKFSVGIVGVSPLIVHKFDEKSRKQMLEKQVNGKKQAGQREGRDVEAEYEGSFYRLADGAPGFPAAGFKKACVSACRYASGLPMTQARGAFFVMGDPSSQGELVRIIGEPQMRADMCRLENGVPMERFRPEFREWSATLVIRHNPDFITAQSIINLLSIAGMNVGVGERRPEREGASFGQFRIVGDDEPKVSAKKKR